MFSQNTPPEESNSPESGWGHIFVRIKTSRHLQLLLILTVVGGILRFYHLGYNSLWLDETATLGFAQHSFSQIWELVVGGEFNPPLFYWIEHIMLYFGNNEVVLRFVPALCGTLSIPIIYLVGKEIQNKEVGLLAAALLTFSPFHIFYSQDARAYSIMMLFLSLAILFYVRTFRSDRFLNWVLFGVCSSVALWAHFYAFVPVAVIFLHAFVCNSRGIYRNIHIFSRIGAAAAVFLLSSLPLIIVMVPLFALRTENAPTWGFQGLDVIYQTFFQFSVYSQLIFLFFMILLVAGVSWIIRDSRKKGAFFIMYLILPLLISMYLSAAMPMIPSYMIYLLPIYFIGISASYDVFSEIIHNFNLFYLFLAVFVIISAFSLPGYYSHYQKNDWRGFSVILADATDEGDVIVVLPGYIQEPLNYYYSNRTDRTLEYGASSMGQLESIVSEHPESRIFFVMTGDLHAVDQSGDALRWLQENAAYAGQDTGISVYYRLA